MQVDPIVTLHEPPPSGVQRAFRWLDWLSRILATIAGAQIVGYLLTALSATMPGGHPPAWVVMWMFLSYAGAALALPAVLVGVTTLLVRRDRVWKTRRLMLVATLLNSVCVVLAATFRVMFHQP